jgi:hypothetical protein
MNRDDDATRSVLVFKTNDPGLLGIVKSVLSDAGITYVVAGEGLQGLFPGSHYGNDFAPRVLVAAEDAEAARELLRGIEGGEAGDGT